MAKHRKPAYTEEFRKEAVLRSQKPGQTTASVAKELGVSPQQIYNWRRQEFNQKRSIFQLIKHWPLRRTAGLK